MNLSVPAKRLLLLLAVVGAFWIAYEISIAGNDNQVSLETPAVVMKNGQAYGERMTSHAWSFRYRKAVARVGETIFDLDGVYDGVIYQHGKPYLRFRAEHVTANTVTRNFAVKGGFHVDLLGDGPTRSLDTTDATWNDGTQTLVLPHRTTIREAGDDQPVSLRGLTLDVRTKSVRAERVNGQVAPSRKS